MLLTTWSFTMQCSNRELRPRFILFCPKKHSNSNAALLKENPSGKEGIISQIVFEICMRGERGSCCLKSAGTAHCRWWGTALCRAVPSAVWALRPPLRLWCSPRTPRLMCSHIHTLLLSGWARHCGLKPCFVCAWLPGGGDVRRMTAM